MPSRSLSKPKLRLLKNGIRVVWIDQPMSTACAIEVFVNVGSRYEEKPINGVSHFIEHLMFKGTKRRPDPQLISKSLDRFGADYNASTSKDRTSYFVKIEADRLPEAIDVLHDMLANSTFKAADIDRERGVIVEEINMYEDNPQSQMGDLLDEQTFGDHPLGWNIAGTREIIKGISREDILKYRERFYQPERLVVAVAGKLPKNTWGLLEKTFGSWKAPKKAKPVENAPVFAKDALKGVRFSLQTKKIEQVQLGMAFLTFPMFDERQEAARLIAIMLGGTMSSRLFTELREKRSLCYSIGAGRSAFEEIGTFHISAGLEKKCLKEAVSVLWKELEKMSTKLVTADELTRAKDFIRGKFYLNFEDPLTQADWYGDQLNYRKHWRTPEERMKALAAVTPAQIRAVAKEIFDRKNYAVSIVGPYESEKEVKGWF